MDTNPLAAIAFPVDAVSDQVLVELRRLSFERSCQDSAPKFAAWLHGWADSVQAARAAGQHVGPFITDDGRQAIGHPLLAAALPVEECDDWGRHDVADALRASSALAHASRNIALGELADRWQQFFAARACAILYSLPDNQEPPS